MAALTPVSRLFAIVEISDDSTVLRVVLTRRISAAGSASRRDAYRAPPTGSALDKPMLPASEKSLRALARSRCKSPFELEPPG
jgi:hypothetical protein